LPAVVLDSTVSTTPTRSETSEVRVDLNTLARATDWADEHQDVVVVHDTPLAMDERQGAQNGTSGDFQANVNTSQDELEEVYAVHEVFDERTAGFTGVDDLYPEHALQRGPVADCVHEGIGVLASLRLGLNARVDCAHRSASLTAMVQPCPLPVNSSWTRPLVE
jgi:hypothetical protein